MVGPAASTTAAAGQLGYKHRPPAVNHKIRFRDSEPRFDTNDAHSGSNRLTGWSCLRYGKLRTDEHELQEYVLHVLCKCWKFDDKFDFTRNERSSGLAKSNGDVRQNDVITLRLRCRNIRLVWCKQQNNTKSSTS